MPVPLAANPFPAIASGLYCSGMGTIPSVAVCANIWRPHARTGFRTSPHSPVPPPSSLPAIKILFPVNMRDGEHSLQTLYCVDLTLP
jgi:hypothetical protein